MRASFVLSGGWGRSTRRAAGATIAAVAAVSSGWLVVSAGDQGIRLQALLVLGAIAVPAAAYLYLTRPHLLLTAYVFVLPFLVSDREGVNPGELITLAVALGGIPLLLVRGRPVAGPVRTIAVACVGLAVTGGVSVYVNSVVSLGNVANGVVKYLVFGIVAILLYVFTDDETKAQGLMKAMVLSGAAVAVFSLFEFATGRSYFPEYGYSRASGTFEHWNQLGGYMALVSFPTIMFAIRSRTGGGRAMYAVAWALQLTALLLSLTLGAVVGVVVGVVVGAFLYFRRSFVKTLAAAIAGLAVVAVVWQTVPEVGEKFRAADARGEARLATYAAGFSALRDNFWFGVGAQEEVLKAVLISNRTGSSVSVVPHNAFLAIGVEKGILGTGLLLVTVIAGLRIVIRKQRHLPRGNRLLVAGVGMGSFAFLTQNMTNLLLLHVRLGIIWIALHVAAARLIETTLPRDA